MINEKEKIKVTTLRGSSRVEIKCDKPEVA